MALGAGEIPLVALRSQIASGVDLIIHLERMRDGSRKVREIVEVLGVEQGEIQLQPIFSFEEKGEWREGEGRMDTQKQNAKRSKVQTICRTGERKKPLVEVSIAVLLTLLVAWIFYNAWYGLLWFPVVYLLSSRIYREEKQAKEGQRKNRAFKELLELLSGFLQAGMSLENSFLQAEGQLAMLGEEGKDMIYALHQMNQKVKVNIAVEQAYMELAEQMDLEEACAFGEILLFAKRLGGNYGKNIQRTATKLGEKMSLQEEITTMMAQKKLEMKVMLVIPLAIIAYVRLTSADLLAVLYGNLAGGLIMSACLVVYVLMALWSRRIMDIVI